MLVLTSLSFFIRESEWWSSLSGRLFPPQIIQSRTFLQTWPAIGYLGDARSMATRPRREEPLRTFYKWQSTGIPLHSNRVEDLPKMAKQHGSSLPVPYQI